MRDYPAYARTIAAHIVRGQKPIVVAVLLSTKWHYYDHVPKICIRPDEWRPGSYEFSYLRGLHVVAVCGDDCSDQQLAELYIELMRAGPLLLWVYDADGSMVFDQDWPDATWAAALGRGHVSYKDAKSAERVMAATQARDADRWLREHERIKARSEDDALQFTVRSYGRTEDTKQRVRQLFSAPFQDAGEPAAA